MPLEFQHYIVTRFNLKASFWNTDKNNNTVASDQWLETRYQIFLDFCLPSVKNQTNQNFKWIAFFDVDTPEKFKKTNQRITQEFKAFTPVYAKSMEAMNPLLLQLIENDRTDHQTHVITTRLDNDDIVHKDFVRVIQDQFQANKPYVIELEKGYILRTSTPIYLSYKIYPGNPFVSLVEYVDKPQTVYTKHHTKWNQDMLIVSVKDGLYWMQNIHIQNTAMKFISRKLLRDYSILNDFGFKTEYIESLPKKGAFLHFLTDLKFSAYYRASKFKQWLTHLRS